MSLLYPQSGIDGYGADQFRADLIDQAAADIQSCFDAGADSVQVDFTEGRLALKLDPSVGLLQQFIDLNNEVFPGSRLMTASASGYIRAPAETTIPRTAPTSITPTSSRNF